MSNGQRFINWLASSRKAIVSFAAALALALGMAADGGLTLAEFLIALAGALGTGTATYSVTNTPKV